MTRRPPSTTNTDIRFEISAVDARKSVKYAMVGMAMYNIITD